ncbi:MAG TPA: ABC transporter permease [Terriglobia bacterium]|nr:ABC transporter permease [Terriglobia bacterium]
MTLRRTKAVARKEFLHILRDPRSLIMALAMPFLLLLLFGYALTLDVDRIPTVLFDRDQSPQSRELLAQFQGSRFFEILGYVRDYASIEKGIDRNTVLLGIVVPPDYSRNLNADHEAPVQVLIDGSDSNTASIALGYVQAVVQSYGSRLQVDAQIRKTGVSLKPALEPRVRVLYNTDLKSKNYIVPGLIAVVLMIISALLTSLTIAREWETGTMEQLLSTPIRPAELVLGKLSAYFVLGLSDLLIALGVGVMIFGVPLRGNGLFLFLTSCIFLFGSLCWGIFLSAAARSQLLAYQLGAITSFLPAFLLSGFVYAIENMPPLIQVVTYIFPARYFITILKGIFLKGIALRVLWIEVVFLSLYSAVVFIIATRKLRQKVA